MPTACTATTRAATLPTPGRRIIPPYARCSKKITADARGRKASFISLLLPEWLRALLFDNTSDDDDEEDTAVCTDGDGTPLMSRSSSSGRRFCSKGRSSTVTSIVSRMKLSSSSSSDAVSLEIPSSYSSSAENCARGFRHHSPPISAPSRCSSSFFFPDFFFSKEFSLACTAVFPSMSFFLFPSSSSATPPVALPPEIKLKSSSKTEAISSSDIPNDRNVSASIISRGFSLLILLAADGDGGVAAVRTDTTSTSAASGDATISAFATASSQFRRCSREKDRTPL
mmetsp:Transcript_11091/g.24466  ORF Transcript_11091/g.24466 Transcript_11091/m.24466 type:complete len:284 (-) Transcript_11091:378-1229(-)